MRRHPGRGRPLGPFGVDSLGSRTIAGETLLHRERWHPRRRAVGRSTGSGAQLVKDVDPCRRLLPAAAHGPSTERCSRRRMNGTDGYELWTSDGSAAGTHPAWRTSTRRAQTSSNPRRADQHRRDAVLQRQRRQTRLRALEGRSGGHRDGAGVVGESRGGRPAVAFTATVSTQLGKGMPTGSVTFSIDGSPPGARFLERCRRGDHRHAGARSSMTSAPTTAATRASPTARRRS